MVVVGVDSDWVENGEEGLVEEHFVIDEVRQPYWQRFVPNKQYELGHDQTDFDEPVHALGLVVHRNQPLQKQSPEYKQNEFLLKKCNGAICEKRHCLKQAIHTH